MQREIIPPEFAPRNTKTTRTPICFGRLLYSEVIVDKLDIDSSTIRKVLFQHPSGFLIYYFLTNALKCIPDKSRTV